MGVEVDMTIWWVASVTPPLKNSGYAPALCFPLVSVFTCFDFVYISFYFQISQEKIKPSLLPHRTVSCGQRVQVSVMLWFETFSFQRHLWSLIYPACCWLTNVLHHPRWGFCQLPHLCPGLHSLSKICLLWFILFFFRLTVGSLMYLGQCDVEMLTRASTIQRTVERLSTEDAAKKFTTVSFKITP